MKRNLMMIMLSCLLVLGLASSASTAQTQKHIPDMLGTWDVTYSYSFFDWNTLDPNTGLWLAQYRTDGFSFTVHSQQIDLFFGIGPSNDVFYGAIAGDVIHIMTPNGNYMHGSFVPGTQSIEGYSNFGSMATFTMTKRP